MTQYTRDALGAPLAVGRMAVSDATLRAAGERDDMKGKAVYVLHTWKDALWEMGPGRRADPPAPRVLRQSSDGAAALADDDSASNEAREDDAAGEVEDLVPQPDPEASLQQIAEESTQPVEQSAAPETRSLTPEGTLPRLLAYIRRAHACESDVSEYLRAALLHAIGTSLASVSFPMPASIFWSSYVLPARPAYAMEIHGLTGNDLCLRLSTRRAHVVCAPDTSALDVKHSTFKNVKTFLKTSAKEGLIKVKETKGDIVVTGTTIAPLLFIW